jgi:hypothetical protein
MINDQREPGTKKQKKLYVKPEIKQVQLKPEEAVLGGCKTDSTAPGPTGPMAVCAMCSTFFAS